MQIDRLTKAGCQKIFQEKKSGASRKERFELASALDFIREGDVLVVTKLDRLARSVLDLSQTAQLLKAKNVDLVVLDQNIDTTCPT